LMGSIKFSVFCVFCGHQQKSGRKSAPNLVFSEF
jgi:hypothetical protein